MKQNLKTILYAPAVFVLGMALFWQAPPLFSGELAEFHLQFDPLHSQNRLYLWPRLKQTHVGLALSGGGARGLAHIGVLKVFEENHIPIHMITGTSIGSIVGGLYASGYVSDEILDISQRIHWENILRDQPQRTALFLSLKQTSDRYFFRLYFKNFRPAIPSAVSPGQRLYDELSKVILQAPYHAIHSFDELKYPFRAIATDLVYGKKVVFDRGDLALAMQASATIPLLFQPVKKDSFLLVDGGVVENIPVTDVKALGADIVIASDVTSPLRPVKNMTAPWEIADQVTTIMQFPQREEQLRQADVVVRPNLGNRTNTDFSNPEQAYRAGEKAAWKVIPIIKKKLLQRLTGIQNRLFSIDRVTTETQLPSDKKIIPFHQRLWTGFEIQQLIETIYREGFWKDVWARVTRQSDQTILEIHRTANPILMQVRFTGNTLFPDSLLLKQATYSLQQPINWKVWEKNCEAIIRFYRKKQISLATIQSIRFDSLSHALCLTIREGRIDTIKVEGNARTKDWVILREFPSKAGDIFYAPVIQKGLTNIYSLGFFNRVRIEYNWVNDRLQLTIRVQEKPHLRFSQSYRYDRDRRLKLLFEFSDQNFMGFGGRVALSQIVGKRNLTTQLIFQNDRIFKTYLTSSANVHYSRIKHYTFRRGNIAGEYQERRTGFYYSFGRQVKRLGTASLALRADEIALRQVFGSGYPIIKTREVGLRMQTIIDERNKMPFPTKGKYYNFYYEVFGQFLGNDIAFSKLYSQTEEYFTFFRRLTLHPRMIWGTADLVTPFQEMFQLGGEDFFYGFREDEIRARRFLTTSFEIRYLLPIKSHLNTYISYREDAGAFWKNSMAPIRGDDFIFGQGVGVSLESILGSFSFHYGKNSLNQKTYYFSAGFQF
ncbi:MAG: BamA/TamA family outer membrane protein [Calditrichaeota bacterium]|nr:BamA/TamA family outer membrane protein [Calditrichota bacterium]